MPSAQERSSMKRCWWCKSPVKSHMNLFAHMAIAMEYGKQMDALEKRIEQLEHQGRSI